MKPRIKPQECSGKSKMIQLLQQNVAMESFTEPMWEDLRATYLAQCSKVDKMIEMICDALRDAGLYDDAAIFILSDHGDFTGDYGLPEKAQNTFENCLTNVPFLV
jgi:arylsulfatase A-like enzyme